MLSGISSHVQLTGRFRLLTRDRLSSDLCGCPGAGSLHYVSSRLPCQLDNYKASTRRSKYSTWIRPHRPREASALHSWAGFSPPRYLQRTHSFSEGGLDLHPSQAFGGASRRRRPHSPSTSPDATPLCDECRLTPCRYLWTLRSCTVSAAKFALDTCEACAASLRRRHYSASTRFHELRQWTEKQYTSVSRPLELDREGMVVCELADFEVERAPAYRMLCSPAGDLELAAALQFWFRMEHVRRPRSQQI